MAISFTPTPNTRRSGKSPSVRTTVTCAFASPFLNTRWRAAASRFMARNAGTIRFARPLSWSSEEHADFAHLLHRFRLVGIVTFELVEHCFSLLRTPVALPQLVQRVHRLGIAGSHFAREFPGLFGLGGETAI